MGPRPSVADAAAAGPARSVQRHRHRRRAGRPQRGDPAEARRHPLHRHREERRCRRYVVREPLSRMSGRQRRAAAYTNLFGVDYSYPYPHCPASENERYFHWVADTFELRDDIVFETEVRSMAWDETTSEWQVSIAGPDGERVLRANGVITAVGFLNRPKLPDIEGMSDFQGPVLPLGALAGRPRGQRQALRRHRHRGQRLPDDPGARPRSRARGHPPAHAAVVHAHPGLPNALPAAGQLARPQPALLHELHAVPSGHVDPVPLGLQRDRPGLRRSRRVQRTEQGDAATRASRSSSTSWATPSWCAR